MGFKPSKYQQAIYDFITNEDGNLVIEAVAGSGKSTTIVNALNIIPSDTTVLFLAFNKSIVDELKLKIGEKPNVTIKTLHSLGASICFKSFRSSINADKYRKYIEKEIKEDRFKPIEKLDKDEFLNWRSNIRQMVDLIRLNLVNTASEAVDIAKKYGIILESNEVELAMKAVKWGITDVTEIDFTDMIYFPNVKNVDVPTYDIVFIDECQDLNTAQRELFLKCVDPDFGRFVAVGDGDQLIYGFAGSDDESFKKLKNQPNTTLLPLSICYRCDRDIIEKAKKLVPQIEARDDAPEGLIVENATIDDIKDGDMVLCRVTAPLVELCSKFISKGVKAYVKGTDTGKALADMLRRTDKENVDDALEELSHSLDKTIEKLCKLMGYTPEDATQTSQYQTLMDKIDAIKNVCAGIEKTEDAIKKIDDIFSDENGVGICLCTVHKAKGLECDRVFILQKNKFYLPWVMNNKMYAKQERNLEYVAITRAKKYLGYIDSI